MSKYTQNKTCSNSMKLEEPISIRSCAYIASLDDDDLRDIVYDPSKGYSNKETLKYIKGIKHFCNTIYLNARKIGGNTGVYNQKQTYRFAKGANRWAAICD